MLSAVALSWMSALAYSPEPGTHCQPAFSNELQHEDVALNDFLPGWQLKALHLPARKGNCDVWGDGSRRHQVAVNPIKIPILSDDLARQGRSRENPRVERLHFLRVLFFLPVGTHLSLPFLVRRSDSQTNTPCRQRPSSSQMISWLPSGDRISSEVTGLQWTFLPPFFVPFLVVLLPPYMENLNVVFDSLAGYLLG